jgi:anti-sigma regulatory factor (Ser/Thr protein kinase)
MLTKWRIDHFSERAELLVTELLTNALTHARTDGGTVTVLLMYAAGTLRLEVRDRDPANLPVLRNADLSEETGRGLTLIDAYADRWGYRGTEAGKAVWGELDNAPPPVARIQPLPPTRRGAGDGA